MRIILSHWLVFSRIHLEKHILETLFGYRKKIGLGIKWGILEAGRSIRRQL